MTSAQTPVIRGCGTRLAGAAYLEVASSPFGQPIEYFLVDPPVRVPSAMGLSPVGVKLLPRPGCPGVFDVYDWVGADSYPNVADFIEEARHFGISRRIAATAQFEQLSTDSRLILVHSRAWIKDANAYLTERRRSCPKKLPAHAPDAPWPPMCAALWWEDIEDGYQPEDFDLDIDPREVFRVFPPANPQFRYRGRERPRHVAHAEYQPAIFASFPLHRIAVVRGGNHEQTAERARKAQLPLEIVDE